MTRVSGAKDRTGSHPSGIRIRTVASRPSRNASLRISPRQAPRLSTTRNGTGAACPRQRRLMLGAASAQHGGELRPRLNEVANPG
jgi:hypothetical protein